MHHDLSCHNRLPRVWQAMDSIDLPSERTMVRGGIVILGLVMTSAALCYASYVIPPDRTYFPPMAASELSSKHGEPVSLLDALDDGALG
jgi:hypothetical protein